jgi:hypothetical protein
LEQKPPVQVAVAPGQLALVRHSTHCPLFVSQMGNMALLHCAFVVQPARQVWLTHEGLAAGQSALTLHCTQKLFARSQTFGAMQLLFARH